MKNLIKQIDQFYKLCLAEVSLEGLLKQALAEGSNDTFLVFLDMLGEVNPPFVEKIKGFKRTREVLIVLNELFPDIIEISDTAFVFKTPFFIEDLKFLGLSQNGKGHGLDYKDFNYSTHFGTTVINIIYNGPKLDNREIAFIIYKEGKDSIDVGLRNIGFRPTTSQDFTPRDEEHEFLQQVIQNYQEKAEADLIKIKKLFATK